MTSFKPADPVLVIASGNLGKVKEFRELLCNFQIQVIAKPESLEVDETGRSFKENARLKAISVANNTGEWALADDSGLSVLALSGKPGIHSARYADSDSERINRLLAEMSTCDDRRAIFVAALCVAAPKDQILIEVEGLCEGVITKAPRGESGFGYDPIFEVIPTGLTYAEMSRNQKQELSHRANAFRSLEPQFRNLIANNSDLRN